MNIYAIDTDGLTEAEADDKAWFAVNSGRDLRLRKAYATELRQYDLEDVGTDVWLIIKRVAESYEITAIPSFQVMPPNNEIVLQALLEEIDHILKCGFGIVTSENVNKRTKNIMEKLNGR